MASKQDINKAGYLEVKQSSKVRGRKLKTWKRKWVTVHQMIDLSTKAVTAKVDVYDDEKTFKTSPKDKMTFLLENVTKVRMAKSKTHPFAFEIVQAEPVLVFSGENDTESFDWMTTFRKILWPQKEEYDHDLFDVSVQTNHHSERVGLSGLYKMSVKPSGITLYGLNDEEVVKWPLSSLKKFYLDNEPNANQKTVLVIDSGPISDTGEGSFRFLTHDADIILKYIGQCIRTVIAQKQQQRQQQQQQQHQQQGQIRDRTLSVTTSERHYKAILENSRTSFLERSESETSSLSSTPPKSPLSVSASPPAFAPVAPPAATLSSDNVLSRPHSRTDSANLSGGIPDQRNLPYVKERHASDGAITNTPANGSATDLNAKPRTQSFTLVQTATSVSLSDSGIILQEGDGRPLAEKARRISQEVRRGSNSFDSAVSTGSFSEEVRISQAISEETTSPPDNASQICSQAIQNNPLPVQPSYVPQQLPNNNPQTCSTNISQLLTPNPPPTAFQTNPGTPVLPNAPLTSNLNVPPNYIPPLPSEPAQQIAPGYFQPFPGNSVMQNQAFPPSHSNLMPPVQIAPTMSTFTTMPTCLSPERVFQQQNMSWSAPMTATLSLNDQHMLPNAGSFPINTFSGYTPAAAPLSAKQNSPQQGVNVVSSLPNLPMPPHANMTGNMPAVVPQNKEQTESNINSGSQRNTYPVSISPVPTPSPFGTPLPINVMTIQSNIRGEVPTNANPACTQELPIFPSTPKRYPSNEQLIQNTATASPTVSEVSRAFVSVHTAPTSTKQQYQSDHDSLNQASLSTRTESPQISEQSTITSEKDDSYYSVLQPPERNEQADENHLTPQDRVPELPPPRKKSPAAIRHQRSSSESKSLANISKDQFRENENVPEQKLEPADSQAVPIYQDIDEGKTIDRVRRHSTGELPKENIYEELKSIERKNSKDVVGNLHESPPELPVRPSTLRRRPNKKGEETKRRSALPNLFNSAELSHKTSKDEKLSVRDSFGDSTQTLSRSSSKDIYSSISSDLDSEREHHIDTGVDSGDKAPGSKLESSEDVSTNNTDDEEKKEDEIIDLFSPSVCDWIKSGKNQASRQVDDLMGFDIPESIQVPIITPTSTAEDSTDVAGTRAPIVSSATASVTDWAIISDSQVTSESFFEPFFSETNTTSENWANFDDFDPFSSSVKVRSNEAVPIKNNNELENTYIDMSGGGSKQKANENDDIEKPREDDDVVTSTTDASEDVYVAPDELK